MPTNHTTRLAAQLTRLAVDVDRVADQLAAEEHLTSPVVAGAMNLLATGLDQLETALWMAEECFDARRSRDYLEAARITAYPHATARAVVRGASATGGGADVLTEVRCRSPA